MSYWSSYENALNVGDHRVKAFDDARDSYTQRQAGNALSGGNYADASNIFARSGDIANAQKMQQYGQQQQDVQRQDEDRQRKQHAEVILKATDAIRRYSQMKPEANPLEAFDAVAPLLGQITDPQALAHIRQQFAQDPQSVLAMAENEAKKALQPVNLGNGGFGVFDPNQSDPTQSLNVLREPSAPAAGGSYRPASPEEKATYGIPADVPAQVGPNGKLEPISGGAAGLKQVPVKITAAHSQNVAKMIQIDQAIAAVNAYPKGFGLMKAGGEGINQRIDPQGVDARAIVANIGSLIIHDRSGAAVTISEQPRLRPFIPTVTDTPEAIVKKLNGLKRQLANENDAMEISYSDGYRPFGGGAQAGQGGGNMPSLADIDAAIARKKGKR